MIDKPDNVFSQYSRTTHANFTTLKSKEKNMYDLFHFHPNQSPRKSCYDFNFEYGKKSLNNVEVKMDKQTPRAQIQPLQYPLCSSHKSNAL